MEEAVGSFTTELSGQPKTLKDIAVELGVSKNRIYNMFYYWCRKTGRNPEEFIRVVSGVDRLGRRTHRAVIVPPEEFVGWLRFRLELKEGVSLTNIAIDEGLTLKQARRLFKWWCELNGLPIEEFRSGGGYRLPKPLAEEFKEWLRGNRKYAPLLGVQIMRRPRRGLRDRCDGLTLKDIAELSGESYGKIKRAFKFWTGVVGEKPPEPGRGYCLKGEELEEFLSYLERYYGVDVETVRLAVKKLEGGKR